MPDVQSPNCGKEWLDIPVGIEGATTLVNVVMHNPFHGLQANHYRAAGSDGAHLPNPLPRQETGWGLISIVQIHKVFSP